MPFAIQAALRSVAAAIAWLGKHFESASLGLLLMHQSDSQLQAARNSQPQFYSKLS